MKVKCRFCLELIDEEKVRDHVLTRGSSCRAAIETVRMLGMGMRPLPATHSLPAWMRDGMVTVMQTRGKYEGEPREEQGFLAVPEEQHWIPRWVDIIVELWSGPIYVHGEVKQAQRDACLHDVKTLWTSSMKKQIVDAYREDLRAVRALLVRFGAVIGDPPMLITEFEALGRPFSSPL